MPRRLLAIAIFACVLASAMAWARTNPHGLTVLVAPALLVWDVIGFLLWVGREACAERPKDGAPAVRARDPGKAS